MHSEEQKMVSGLAITKPMAKPMGSGSIENNLV